MRNKGRGVGKMANALFLARIVVIDLLSLNLAAILENTYVRFHSLQPSICHLPQPTPFSSAPSTVRWIPVRVEMKIEFLI
jgi:hypothetical protein